MATHLLTGETLMLPPLRRHWVLLVRSLVFPALVAGSSAALVNVLARGLLPPDIRLVLTAAVAAPVGLCAIVAWLRWEGDSLTVTDQRVLLEEGVLRRSSKVIPLHRVQDVSTVQTLLGRLLDYGTLEIDAAGAGGVERFAYVGGPVGVRDRLSVLIARCAGEAA